MKNLLTNYLRSTSCLTNVSGELLQSDSYYPFGIACPDFSSGTMDGKSYYNTTQYTDNKNLYLYNGKELQTDLDLDWYDYGACMYDAQIARWAAVDPMAEKYFGNTPYNYCLNNPLLFIDPLGMDTAFADNKSRKLVNKYSDKYKRDKKGNIKKKKEKNVKNKHYNKAFADIITKQAGAEETYNYSFDESGNSGGVSFDGTNVNITLVDPGEGYGAGMAGILFEEVKHTDQFLNGETYFTLRKDGTWGIMASLQLELDAKAFVIEQLGTNNTFVQDGFNVPTQLGYIKKNPGMPAMNFLQAGVSNYSVTGSNGRTGTVNIPGAYPDLRISIITNKVKVRTLDLKKRIFAYPKK